MGKRKYNAEAAELRGEVTRRDLCMGTLTVLDGLTRQAIVRRNNTRKRYWLPQPVAEVLAVEIISPPAESTAEAGMVLSPVGVVLEGLEQYVTSQPRTEVSSSTILTTMRELARQTGSSTGVQ